MKSGRLAGRALACAALVFLLVMVFTGARPRQQQFVAFEAAGVLEVPPAEVRALEVAHGGRRWRLTRTDGEWRVDGAPLAAAARAQLELALKVLHASRPVRVLRAAADAARLAEYGLDEPMIELRLDLGGQRMLGVAFGELTPDAGLRYLRLAGSADVQLVSTFVHDEWQGLAEALRDAP